MLLKQQWLLLQMLLCALLLLGCAAAIAIAVAAHPASDMLVLGVKASLSESPRGFLQGNEESRVSGRSHHCLPRNSSRNKNAPGAKKSSLVLRVEEGETVGTIPHKCCY